MASISAIARDWRVSRPYVSRCVNHRGCPTSSLADAREWRECYASNRPAVARQTEKQGNLNSSEDNAFILFVAARDMAWRGYDAILDLILELPKNVAAQCNPSNPQSALAVLDSECTGILCDAGDVYAAWSKVRPPFFSARNSG